MTRSTTSFAPRAPAKSIESCEPVVSVATLTIVPDDESTVVVVGRKLAARDLTERADEPRRLGGLVVHA